MTILTPDTMRTWRARSRSAVGRDRPRSTKRSRREAGTFYVFVSPWILGFVVFTMVPMAASLWLSLTDYRQPPHSPSFVGFANYVRMFTDDPLFWKALGQTLYFAGVSVPLSLMIALFLANLLHQRFRLVRFFRTVIYLPALVPLVAAAILFRWLLAPTTGPINGFLALFGVEGPAWLLDADWVIPAIILLSIWQVGAGTILLIAALQGIPAELHEAAVLDGANRRQIFWRVTVPLVTPILFFNLITGMIGAFQVFAQVFVLTDSGPNNASLMMVPYIYNTAFRYYEMGYASALAWVFFGIILIFSAAILRTAKFWVFYETEVRK